MRRLLAALSLLALAMLAAAAQENREDARRESRFRALPGAEACRRVSESQAGEAIASLSAGGLPPGAAEALASIVASAGPGFVPPGLDARELAEEAVCAKAVSRMFWSAFGGEDDPATARGVSGDAWNMSTNVRRFGGKVLPWAAVGPSGARPGDILGLHYALSAYNDRPKPADYTHLALVVAATAADGPLVAHCWRPPLEILSRGASPPWPLRLEFLRDLEAGFPGLFSVVEVIRPRATGAAP